MRNPELVDLNFRSLLNYGGQPPVRNAYASRPKCRGYCVNCEESGILERVGGHLDLMSHGCDSSDFVDLLGPLPDGDGPVHAEPILFLLEDPGGDYDNGARRRFRGFHKQPPINHYYWTPDVKTWPTRVSDFNGNFYGNYFAYLMQKHRLSNVYITNVMKCGWKSGEGSASKAVAKSAIAKNCIKHYLMNELEIFGAHVAFCFGRKAENYFYEFASDGVPDCKVVYLTHPAARCKHETLLKQNDDWVERALVGGDHFSVA